MKEEKAILVPDNWSDFPLKVVLEIMHKVTLSRSKGETAVFTAALTVCVHNSFTVKHPNEVHYVPCMPPSQRLCIKHVSLTYGELSQRFFVGRFSNTLVSIEDSAPTPSPLDPLLAVTQTWFLSLS